MKMRDYELTQRAVDDIASARDWYEMQRAELGNRFLRSVVKAIGEARAHPVRFPEMYLGVRAVGCKGFPYRVYYEPHPDRIVVRAVYHTARDPKSWDDPARE